MEKITLNVLPVSIWLLLLFLPLTLAGAGCSKDVESYQHLISISPEALEFGKVRPTDSPVKLTFDIFNNSNTDVVIANIISGCGCAAIDTPREPIPPNGKVAVTLSVNVWGRSGLFEDNVTIKTATESLRVPIRGTIEADIWTVGQALRSTVGTKEQHASAILTVYTTKYPDIIFVEGQQADGVTLTEIARITQSGETAIRFSVDVDVAPNSFVMRTIKVVPADASIAPLTIPFYCHREE